MIRDGEAPFGPLGRDVTLGPLIERYLRDSQLNSRTTQSYGINLRKHVMRYFGADRRVRTIRRKDVIAFRTWLTESSGLEANTRVNVFAALSTLMTAAADIYEAHDGPNPCFRLRPRGRRRKPVLLTWAEVERLAAAVPPRYEVLIWLVALAGLRPGEAFGLTIDRVRFLERTLLVQQQVQDGAEDDDLKTEASYAELPVDQMLLDKIAVHWSRWRGPVSPQTAASRRLRGIEPPAPSRLVAVNRCGRPVRRNDFNKCFREAVVQTGLDPRLHFHDLKHFYTSVLAACGEFDPKTVQALSRHQRFAMTWDTYAHPPVVAGGVRVTAFTALADGQSAQSGPPREEAG